MKIGLSTMIFGKEKRLLTLEEVKIVAGTSMKYIELADSHDIDSQILNYLKQNDISIFSIHAEYLNSDISDTDNNRRINSIDNVKKRIDRINELGGNIVIVHPGGWCRDKKEKENKLKICINSLVEITRYGNSKKVKVAIENLPMEFLGDDPGLLKTVLSQVRSKTGLNKEIGVCLDTGHASLTGTLFEHFELFSNDIISIHLQDNTGYNHQDRSLALDDIHIPPGYGLIPWEKFLKKLIEIEYNSGLIFELKPDSIKDKNWQFVLHEALKFVKSEEFFAGDRILQI